MEGKRPKNEQGQSNCGGETFVEKSAKMLCKALVLIERELLTCDEDERQTQLAQNIRQILEQTRQNTLNGILVEIPREIPLVPTSSAEKALQIAVVVRHVLRNLGSSSVLACRRVCKIWEDEATRQLLTSQHENKFKIRFEWCKRKGKYLYRNKKTLQDFHETCGNESKATAKARQFLCSQTKIVFEGGDLNTTREYFFHDFGVFVRFLSLKPKLREETLAQIREFKSNLHSILMDLTPNLESLHFKTSWRTLTENTRNVQTRSEISKFETAEDGTRLEKLKVLKLTFYGMSGSIQWLSIQQQNSFDRLRAMIQTPRQNLNLSPHAGTNASNAIVRKILEQAPNLQLILNPDFVHTRQIVATGTFQLIKSLDLKFPPIDSHLFLQFAATNPKLSSLKLIKKDGPTKNPSAAEITALGEILQSSRSTLEHFDGIHRLKNMNGIQLTAFPLIKKLCLTQRFVNSNSPRINGRILPSSFDFDHVFPNLVSLQFDLLQEGKSNPFNFDGNANASSSLEFAVKKDFNPLWMKNISSLYPNLKSLHVKISDKFTLFPLVCKSIWSCLTQLTKLHLTVELDPHRHLNKQQENGAHETGENEEKNPIDEMDSIFTGFSPKFCRKLKQEDSTLPMPMTMSDAVSLENLRESSSILDMKRLTELKICCVKFCPAQLWSQVTEVLAFEKMKQRQNVKVQVTQRI